MLFHLTGDRGLALNLSEPGSAFVRYNEGGSWGGNFAPGDHLLFTGNTTNLGNGPITVVFGAPVSAAGYQIEAYTGGPFTARLEAFDSANNDLGFVTQSGTSSSGNNTAAFIGGTRPTNDIKRIVISLDSSSGDPTSFGINRLDFRAVANTPEPGELALLIGLVASAGAIALRHRRLRC